MRRAWIFPLLTLAGCGRPDHLYLPLSAGSISVQPSPLRLRREAEPCTPHALDIEGYGALTGMWWEPASGDEDDLRLPSLSRVELDGAASVTVDFCPGSREPVEGALSLLFSDEEIEVVWATEEVEP